MKRIFCFSLIVLSLLCGSPSNVIFADQNSPAILINGDTIHLKQAPIVVDGRTLVPFRSIFEIFKVNVNWDDTSKTITAVHGDTIAKLQVGSKVAFVNDKPIELEIPAQIVESTTMVPLRFVNELLGFQTDWDQSNNTINIIIPQK